MPTENFTMLSKDMLLSVAESEYLNASNNAEIKAKELSKYFKAPFTNGYREGFEQGIKFVLTNLFGEKFY